MLTPIRAFQYAPFITAGHTLVHMRKKMHMKGQQCVSPIGGMYHWNYMPADVDDGTVRGKVCAISRHM